MFGLFKKQPQVQTQEVEPVGLLPTAVVTNTGLRLGMWVNAVGRVGIVTDLDEPLEVTHTAADGTTVMELVDGVVVPSKAQYASALVRQATISEIPTNRYTNVEQLRVLGYKD